MFGDLTNNHAEDQFSPSGAAGRICPFMDGSIFTRAEWGGVGGSSIETNPILNPSATDAAGDANHDSRNNATEAAEGTPPSAVPTIIDGVPGETYLNWTSVYHTENSNYHYSPSPRPGVEIHKELVLSSPDERYELEGLINGDIFIKSK